MLIIQKMVNNTLDNETRELCTRERNQQTFLVTLIVCVEDSSFATFNVKTHRGQLHQNTFIQLNCTVKISHDDHMTIKLYHKKEEPVPGC